MPSAGRPASSALKKTQTLSELGLFLKQREVQCTPDLGALVAQASVIVPEGETTLRREQRILVEGGYVVEENGKENANRQ